MRILCLHDQGSNARQLQSQLHRLGKRLLEQYGIDLIYINAPLVMDDNHDNHDDHDNDGRPRTWWQTSRRLDKKDNADNNESHHIIDSSEEQQHQQQQHQYLGLDASLLLLQQVWKTSTYPSGSSIMGILGVGQGAQIGALLSLILYSNQYESCLDQQEEQQNIPIPAMNSIAIIPPPRFAIWINATSSLLPEQERLTNNEMECLHLIPSNHNNAQSSSSSSSLLYQQFGGQVIVQEDDDEKDITAQDDNDDNDSKRKGLWWTKAAYVNHMGRFLLEQKRTLQKLVYASLQLQQQQQQQQQQQSLSIRDDTNDDTNDDDDNNDSDDNDCRVLVLQQALLLAQHEASAMIAQEIAKNPPAALMAIIQPTSVAVGGNANDRLPRPAGGDDAAGGGGAPCPSEFLLQRNKRQSNHSHHHDDDNKSASTNQSGERASREHPSQRQPDGHNGQECHDNDGDVHMEG